LDGRSLDQKHVEVYFSCLIKLSKEDLNFSLFTLHVADQIIVAACENGGRRGDFRAADTCLLKVTSTTKIVFEKIEVK
jgi:hypothetical protein